MSDLISRQAAIDALINYFKKSPTIAIRARGVVEELPSAQPERKKGKWIWKNRQLNSNYYVEGITENGDKEKVYVHRGGSEAVNYCSECGKRGDDTFLNFCPNCGADMRGEQDE